jgi:tetratricopeptide (TPR) repeat protein
VVLPLIAALLAGCATVPLDAARSYYRAGRPDRAGELLATAIPADHRDRVLLLMERGMVRHVLGRYEESSRDWIDAAERIAELETYSLSRGAGSLVLNDKIQFYRGVPFEWSLLHALTALNHFQLGRWDEAGVEARRVVEVLERSEQYGFPPDAFSAYVAGVALELADDPSNAALLYRRAATSAPPGIVVSEQGWIAPAPPGHTGGAAQAPKPAPVPDHGGQLICFALLGQRTPPYAMTSYVEIRVDGRTLGRSYMLGDTHQLAVATDQRLAALRAAKTATRLVIKEVIVQSVEHNTDSPALAALLRWVLWSLEKPDTRAWETLPRFLHAARVPCPASRNRIEVVFHSAGGGVARTVEVERPPPRRGPIWVLVVNDRLGLRPAPSRSN